MKRLIPLLFLFTLFMGSCSNITDTSSLPHSPSTLPGSSSDTTSPICPPKSDLAHPPSSGPITLTVRGWSSTTAESNLVLAILNDFQKLHPSIKLNWISLTGNYEDKMSLLNAKNQLPDVFFISPSMASTYISKQKLLNLTPYMQRDHVQTSSYDPFLFTPFMCKDTVYAIPKDWSTLGLVYNKTLFRQAGLAFPDATWTWNTLRNAALKLTNLSTHDTSRYGISLPDDASRWLAFLFANGGSVLDASQTKAVFNSPNAIAALDFYSSMQLQDHSSVLPVSLNDSWPGQPFGEQRTAMVIEGSWLIPFMSENYPQVDYGIAPLPMGPQHKRANLLFTNAWAASASTKYPEASWELIQYLTSMVAQTRILHSGLALPSLASLAHDPSIQQSSKIKALFEALPYSTLDYYGTEDTFIHNHIHLALQNVLQGQMSAQDALNDAVSQVDSKLSP